MRLPNSVSILHYGVILLGKSGTKLSYYLQVSRGHWRGSTPLCKDISLWFFRSHLCLVARLLLYAFVTYLRTPWCRVLLEKLTGLQLVKKFPAFHGTRRFITALTSVRHLSLSWASPIQSIPPHPTSCRSILILSTHLRLGLPSGLLPSGFPTKTLYTPSPHPYAPHAQPISFFLILSPAQYRMRSTSCVTYTGINLPVIHDIWSSW